jgi:hypothetical protein
MTWYQGPEGSGSPCARCKIYIILEIHNKIILYIIIKVGHTATIVGIFLIYQYLILKIQIMKINLCRSH